jgi:hypothetical protein
MTIDFHLHYLREPDFVANTLRSMDEAAIDKACIVPFDNFVFTSVRGRQCGDNSEVLQVVKGHPDRFIGCIYVDPRRKETLQTIDQYHQEGFRCVKMHPTVGYYPNDARWEPVFARIEELGLPIMIHGGWTGSYVLENGERNYLDSVYGRPEYVDHPARMHPNIKFVVAHMAQPYFLEAYSLADHNPNVYLDLCLRYPQRDILAEFCKTTNIFKYLDLDRLVWGTDNFLTHRETVEETKKLLRRVGVPKARYEAIFGGTAAKILGL